MAINPYQPSQNLNPPRPLTTRYVLGSLACVLFNIAAVKVMAPGLYVFLFRRWDYTIPAEELDRYMIETSWAMLLVLLAGACGIWGALGREGRYTRWT